MNEFVNIISSVGFPIAMCIYLTITMNKTLESVKESINNNTLVVKELSNEIKKGSD